MTIYVYNPYLFCLSAFTLNSSFWWIILVSGSLGFLRCFIQTPLPLVVAEQYGQRFTTAFSLYMVVCGFVALGVGLISGE